MIPLCHFQTLLRHFSPLHCSHFPNPFWVVVSDFHHDGQRYSLRLCLKPCHGLDTSVRPTTQCRTFFSAQPSSTTSLLITVGACLSTMRWRSFAAWPELAPKLHPSTPQASSSHPAGHVHRHQSFKQQGVPLRPTERPSHEFSHTTAPAKPLTCCHRCAAKTSLHAFCCSLLNLPIRTPSAR